MAGAQRMGSQVLLTTRRPHAQRRCRQGAAGGVGPRVRKFSLKRPPKPGAQCAAHPSRLPSRPWELSRFPLPPWPGSGTVVGFPAFSFLILAHPGATDVYENEDREGGGRRQKKSSFILQSVWLAPFSFVHFAECPCEMGPTSPRHVDG